MDMRRIALCTMLLAGLAACSDNAQQQAQDAANKAAEATKKWWRALRRFVVANSTKVSRFGPWDTGRLNAYAFPEAMHAIRGGVPRAENPPPWG